MTTYMIGSHIPLLRVWTGGGGGGGGGSGAVHGHAVVMRRLQEDSPNNVQGLINTLCKEHT